MGAGEFTLALCFFFFRWVDPRGDQVSLYVTVGTIGTEGLIDQPNAFDVPSHLVELEPCSLRIAKEANVILNGS